MCPSDFFYRLQLTWQFPSPSLLITNYKGCSNYPCQSFFCYPWEEPGGEWLLIRNQLFKSHVFFSPSGCAFQSKLHFSGEKLDLCIFCCVLCFIINGQPTHTYLMCSLTCVKLAWRHNKTPVIIIIISTTQPLCFSPLLNTNLITDSASRN